MSNLVYMAGSTKKRISPEKIQRQIDSLEELVYKKTIKPKQAHKQMVTLACELVCSDQPEQAIMVLTKIPKEYFKLNQVKDTEEDSDYALSVLVLFESLLLYFEDHPQISPNLPMAEA